MFKQKVTIGDPINLATTKQNKEIYRKTVPKYELKPPNLSNPNLSSKVFCWFFKEKKKMFDGMCEYF